MPVTVTIANGASKMVQVNQKTGDGRFSLGHVILAAGKPVTVTVSNKGTDGHVVVDAVQWVPVK